MDKYTLRITDQRSVHFGRLGMLDERDEDMALIVFPNGDSDWFFYDEFVDMSLDRTPDIIRQVATKDPYCGNDWGDYCFYCGEDRDSGKHEDDCTWILANKVLMRSLPPDASQ